MLTRLWQLADGGQVDHAQPAAVRQPVGGGRIPRGCLLGRCARCVKLEVQGGWGAG
jgi:hypothetical protein